MPSHLRAGRAQPLLSLLICILLLSGCSGDPNVRKQKFYNAGLDYLKKGDVKKAALQFQNALQIDATFAEAANVLGEINFRQGNYAKAYSLLQQATAAKPEYLPPHKGLSQLYRLSGKLDDAVKEYQFILDHSPDDIETLFSLAAVQAKQKKFADAEGSLNHVLELQPNQVGALIELASLKKEMNDLPAAEHYYKLGLEKNPRSIPAYLALIKFLISTGRASEAEPVFSQALQMNSNNITVLEAQAGYYEGLKRNAEAEAVSRRIQSLHPSDPKYWGTVADFFVRVGDWSRAKAELDTLSQQHKNDPGILHKLIEVHLSLNERDAARNLNDALLKQNPKDSYGHLFRGRLYLDSGDIDNAIVQFNEAAKYQQDSAALHYWLAQAQIGKGELQQARQELETALRYNHDYQAALTSLAKIDSASGQIDRALAESRKLASNNPQDTESMLLYCQSLLKKGDFSRAEKVLKMVLAGAPGNAEGHRLSGVVYLSRQNLPEARKEFRQAWELQPQSKSLLEGVVLGYFVAKQPDGAISFLQEEIKTHPGSALLYEELGQAFLMQHNRTAAIPALQTALKLAPTDTATTTLLADSYAGDGKANEAVRLLSEADRQNPKDSNLWFQSGTIFEKLERWDDARNAYEHALQFDSDNALIKNNLAWVLTEHGGNIDLALKLAQEAKEKLYDNPQVTDTIGWVYYKKGIYKTAQEYLKQSAEKDQKNPKFQFQLGMAELKLGNQKAARQNFLNATTADPKSPDAALARAALAQL